MPTTAKTKKPAAKPTAARTSAAKARTTAAPAKARASKPRAKAATTVVRVTGEQPAAKGMSTLELRVILLITLFVSLCILFVQVYARNN